MKLHRLLPLMLMTAFPLRAEIVISEIHCDSEPNPRRSEFVELFNNGPSEVNLSGWRFTDGISYSFPRGTSIPPGGHLVVAEDLAGFRDAYAGTPQSQVIAHWHFDETTGTTAADTSGVLNGAGEAKTAVASGGVNQDAEGKFGGSGVAIDGVAGSFLTIPHLNDLWSGSYTLAAWVKPADTTSNAILSDMAAPQAFLFNVDTALRMTHRYNSTMPSTAAAWTAAGGTVTAGAWHHVAVSWDAEAQVVRAWLNGALIYRSVIGKMPAELALVRNARLWNIGRRQDTAECFNGLLDELWVLRGALNGAAVTTLMNENRVAVSETVDLADVVSGGDGTRPGADGRTGLSATTGQELPGMGAGDHAPSAPGNFSPVAHPYIDGVFVPNGTLSAGQQITSTGLTFFLNSGDADPSPGYWFNGGGLLGDPSKVNSTSAYYLPKYLEDPLSHSVLAALTQKGITFDLNEIEAARGGRQVTAFTAVAGESRVQAGGNVTIFVLLDGVEKFRQASLTGNETVIDLPVPPDARFLTLAVSNADGNNINDQGFFANPLVHLESPGMESAPPVLGPYAGGLQSGGETLTLRDYAGVEIDTVEYRTEFPWPVGAGGEGQSMELIHPSLDNSLGGSWRASRGGPTPGAANSVHSSAAPPQIRQVDHSPKMPPAGAPFSVSAKVTDPQGVSAVQLHYQIVLPGSYIPSHLSLTTAQLVANPSTPRTPNPAFENPASWIPLPMLDNGNGADTVSGDSIYTAQIPAQINRTLVRYRITVTDTDGNSLLVPYADDPSLNFAAYVYNGVPDFTASTRSVTGRTGYVHPKEVLTSLPVYSLLTSAADLTRCIAYNGADQIPADNFESREAFNWNGTFVYDGQVYDHIRYRLRQRNDRYGGAGKRSFRFRFNRGNYAQFHDFEGNPYPEKWRTLNTHKMSARGGINMGLHEMANQYLWRLFGHPSPSVHWFHFRVVDGVDEAPAGTNGQFLGDFFGMLLGLEDYDSRFLSARDMPEGNLYKLNSYILNGKEVQRFQAGGRVSDASDFYNILWNLRSPRTNDWLNTHVDFPAWYRYHAVIDAVRHYDVAPNTGEHMKNRSWYFRPDPATPLGKLVTLPWDSDTSWGPNWGSGEDFTKAAVITPNKPDYVRDYRNVVREFRDLIWQRDQIEPLLDLFQGRMAAFHLADRDRWTGAPAAAGSQTDPVFATKIADMKKFAFIGGSWEGGDDPSDAAAKDSGISGQQGRDAFLDFLQNDTAIPATPAVTYTGSAGYPANGLAFASSAFADPQGAGTFGAMEWRIAEYLPGQIQGDDVPIIAAKSTWKWEASGTDLGTAWRASAYDDSAWQSGPGEFGYGETGQGTTLPWGADSLNRYPTYYFRRKFTVTDPARFTGFRLGVQRDDGAVVYIDGVEVFRTGMPAAPNVISYTTRATSDVTGTNETTFFPLVMPLSALTAGEHTIAVEVHQVSAGNTDLRFDLTLGGIPPVPPLATRLVWEYDHRWKSPLITSFSPNISIPPAAVRENRTYRVRVRHQDNSGRWSHWSAPAQFVTTQPGIQPLLENLAVSELMYDPPAATPAESLAGWTSSDFEFIELENRSAVLTLDLADVRFTQGVNADIPPGTTLAPGARCLVVRNKAAFESRYGTGLPVVAEFPGSRLDNGGEPLKLSYGGGVPIREFRYDDDPPWPAGSRNTGAGISFLPASPLSAQANGLRWRSAAATPGGENLHPGTWEAWAASCFDPGAADFSILSDPAADPDQDGQTNALESVLGSAPHSAQSTGVLETMIVNDAGQDYLALSWLAHPGTTVRAEASADLTQWNPASLAPVSSLPSADGTPRITMREAQPLGASPHRFLRLRATRP